ncbi:hypothetical protein ISCGN_031772 [Ixodes scapularis]
MMTVTYIVMWYAPLGLFSMTAGLALSATDLTSTMGDHVMYFMAVLIALLVHGLFTMPCLYMVLSRRHLGPFLFFFTHPLSLAFGSASSSASLPVTISALEDGMGLDPRLVRLVASVGTVLNQDGTVIYLAVTVLFYAQKTFDSYDFGQYALVGLMCIVVSMGVAPAPQACLKVALRLLRTMNVYDSGAVYLLYTDWLLDRLATAVNVLGDGVVATAVHQQCHELLRASSDADNPRRRDSLRPT